MNYLNLLLLKMKMYFIYFQGNLKIKITADIINKIFRDYPIIKDSYNKEVNIIKTEEQFWEDVCKTYFHRNRVEEKKEVNHIRKYTKEDVGIYVIFQKNQLILKLIQLILLKMKLYQKN